MKTDTLSAPYFLALAETNAELEKLDAEGRVAWALD
ncbi:hypothetical protein O5290_30140, partial [Escherichia coli]|nr:hypothetical protein [Escherichia coli]